jgi:hypothetical protein
LFLFKICMGKRIRLSNVMYFVGALSVALSMCSPTVLSVL